MELLEEALGGMEAGTQHRAEPVGRQRSAAGPRDAGGADDAGTSTPSSDWGRDFTVQWRTFRLTGWGHVARRDGYPSDDEVFVEVCDALEVDVADCDRSGIEVCRLDSGEPWRPLRDDPATPADRAISVLEQLHENGLVMSESHRERLRLLLLDGHE